jgi:hypothetical protein
MAKYLLAVVALMALAATYFYQFTTPIDDMDAVIKKAGGTALIVEKAEQLNSTDHGNPQLLNYFNDDIPATDWTADPNEQQHPTPHFVNKEPNAKRRTYLSWLMAAAWRLID